MNKRKRTDKIQKKHKSDSETHWTGITDINSMDDS